MNHGFNHMHPSKWTQTRLFLGATVLCILTFASCISDREISYLNDQIMTLNNKVAKLQESMQNKIDRNDLEGNIEPRLKAIHNRQAETEVEIDQLKRSNETLSGRVEDNELIIKRTVERDLGEQESTRAELDKLLKLAKKVDELQKYLGLEPGISTEESGAQESSKKEATVQTTTKKSKEETEIGEVALRIAEIVRPKLVQDGMFLVGLDVVGDKLMEINVFSPGGLGRAQKLTRVNFCRVVIQALQRAIF